MSEFHLNFNTEQIPEKFSGDTPTSPISIRMTVLVEQPASSPSDLWDSPSADRRARSNRR
jgi:hypothetical protein